MRQQYDHEMMRQKCMIEQLEAQLEATKRQHNEEARQLRDENEHLRNDRKAFKCIMEKVQARVDIIDKSTRDQKQLTQTPTSLLTNNPALTLVKESNKQVEETTKILQQLLTHAIQAVTDIPTTTYPTSTTTTTKAQHPPPSTM